MNKFKLGLLVYDTHHCDILDFYADKLDTIYFNSDGNLCTGDKIFDKTKEEPYRPLRIDLNAIKEILRLNYDVILIYDALEFFLQLDINCHHLPQGIREGNYIYRLENDYAFYLRELNVKLRCKSRNYRYFKTQFVNFSSYVPHLNFEDLFKTFSQNIVFDREFSQIEKFDLIFKNYKWLIENQLGINFWENKYTPYTVGSLIKKAYLKESFPQEKNKLEAYQKLHPISERLDMYLRERKLLMGGILYAKIGTYSNCKKYDINSHYSAVTLFVQDWHSLKRIKLEEINPQFEQILVLKNVNLSLKKDMPGVFRNPFQEEYRLEDNIIIEQWAVYKSLLDILNYFYDIDFEVDRIYQFQKKPDLIMSDLILRNYRAKQTARINNDKPLTMISKLILNNIHGKMVQLYINQEKIYQGIDRLNSEIKVDYSQHFDFIRGSLIYSMANVKILNDIKYLCEIYGPKTIKEKLIYVDTDCLVLEDIELPYITSSELGDYKLELEACNFTVLAPKIYMWEDISHETSGVFAGHIKEEVLKVIPPDLNYQQKVEFLKTTLIPTVVRKRTGEGLIYEQILRPVAAQDFRDEILD